MNKIISVADKADMIVNGYAFTKLDENVRVLNLNDTRKAVCLSEKGEVLKTSMDDIELSIVKDYYMKNMFLMEA